MSARTKVGPSTRAEEHLTAAECEAVLARVCIGHIAFARAGRVEVLPIRFAYVDSWAYFRADSALREVIAAAPWLVLSVIEQPVASRAVSVVVRGGCYETTRTGAASSDAAALRGIVELRDRASVLPSAAEVERTSLVYRLHADDIVGVDIEVPCPPGDRPFDAAELAHLAATGTEQTITEDERADDDGMASSAAPSAPDSTRVRPA